METLRDFRCLFKNLAIKAQKNGISKKGFDIESKRAYGKAVDELKNNLAPSGSEILTVQPDKSKKEMSEYNKFIQDYMKEHKTDGLPREVMKNGAKAWKENIK